MFLPHSRYHKVSTVETTSSTGETVTALKLRRLTPATGDPQMVQAGERLDLLAQARTGDATQFWHVADANTALDGRELVDTPGETVIVPRT
ncbi:MAG TPA: hypothetical protein PKW63_13710 [Vicinamibacterales bacterium]|nr:hypothetical protein [Acidobacteriota bacterium]HQX82815.1 hypothetical protein [Vicinamibacterales bacterium]